MTLSSIILQIWQTEPAR